MLKTVLLIFILNLSFISCQQSTDNDKAPLDPSIIMFEKPYVTITADTNKVIFDKPITITIKSTPLFTGKGRYVLKLLGGGTSLIFDSLKNDKLHSTDSLRSRENFVSFNENRITTKEWKIWFLDSVSYSFGAEIAFDSLFIADSSRHYLIPSKEIETIYPQGFRSSESAYPTLDFIYP